VEAGGGEIIRVGRRERRERMWTWEVEEVETRRVGEWEERWSAEIGSLRERERTRGNDQSSNRSGEKVRERGREREEKTYDKV
jgi:hypothetical protein